MERILLAKYRLRQNTVTHGTVNKWAG